MRADNASRANDFMTQLNSGEGMANRSPVLSLRNKLIDRSSGIGVFGDVTDTICCVALAWYMAIDGDSGTVTVAKARAAWGGWGTEL
jgi:hypothetical protein